MPKTKKCSHCKKRKKITRFYKANWCLHGVRPECRKCNKKRRRVNHKKAMKKDPSIRRFVVLKNKYGITKEQFEALLLKQNNVCSICSSPDPGPNGVFAVDHCHKTQKVRGLLCYLCNIGLGSFRDNRNFLSAAIKYLEDTNG